ncbi:MAG: SBBP repeat-containing protein [bacterium]
MGIGILPKKHFNRVFVGLCFIGLGVAFGQIEVWTGRYDGGIDDWDEAREMAFTPAGDIVMTGFIASTDGFRDIATVKFTTTEGDTVWTRRWRFGTGSREEAVAIACDSAGNVFVAGWFRTSGVDTNWVTIRYLADGTESWVSTYDSAGGPDKAVALVPDEADGVYVTGYSFNGVNRDYVTIHYLANGTRDWVARYNGVGNGNDLPTRIVRDREGSVYVTGYSWGGPIAKYDYLTIKYSSAGETIWTRRYDGTATDSIIKSDYALGLTVDDSSNVYVTGRAGESGTWYDATTIKYSPTGETRWVARFDWGENALDGAGEIEIASDKSIYCAGYTETNIGYFDMLLFKLTPAGEVDWQRIYNYVSDDDSVTGMSVDRFGNVYITGYSYTVEGDLDWVTLKYNPEGAQVWMARHATWDEDDQPYGVLVNSLGDVFVGGYDYLEGSEDYALVKYSSPDVGVALIIQPRDTFRLDAVVTPRVRVKNYSALPFTFPVRLEIGNFYFDIQQVPALGPYDSTEVSFYPWQVRDLGEHLVRCYTMLNGDKEPANDTAMGLVTTVSAWEQLANLPPGPRAKGVKDGGALTFAQDSLVFAFKGNNTTEFCLFNTMRQEWSNRESIPAIGRSGAKKRVKAGAALTADTTGKIYATKGNNTIDFWRYSIANNRWEQIVDFPPGTRGVKGGAGLVYLPSVHKIYALRGGNSSDFYSYNIARDSWEVKRSVPPGDRNKRIKDGTAIATDGDSTIYLLKGGTNEFWVYRVGRDTWVRKPDIPDSRIIPKRRKMKKGGSMAFDPEFVRVYAMKGGKTTEFWFYDVRGDSWYETVDTFPRGRENKAPYGGGAFAYGAGKVYALKGNKTLEFWRYHANFPLNPPLYGLMGAQAVITQNLPDVRLEIVPNPVVGSAVVLYTLPRTGRVRLGIYDIVGREQRLIVDGYQPAGGGRVNLKRMSLARGVYFLRLEMISGSEKNVVTKKFLIAR